MRYICGAWKRKRQMECQSRGEGESAESDGERDVSANRRASHLACDGRAFLVERSCQTRAARFVM
jgi:hypothetical protein